MSNPKSIRNSHTATARELYFANIAATAATTERTLLVVWSDELRMNHQGNAWELEALQAARVAVRDALNIVASAPAAITPAATDSRPTHANATQVELASLSARTRGAIARYGIARCVSAYRLNAIDGEGAAMIGRELDLRWNQANAACDAGREIATARGLFHHAKTEASAPAAVDALAPDAVLVVNSTDAVRVQGMAAYLTLSGVPHLYARVGGCSTIAVNRADVSYTLDHWSTFRPEDASGMLEQLAKDKAAGVTAWPVPFEMAAAQASVGASAAPPPQAKSKLDPAAIEAMAAVCARVTFSNLLTREQALQVYRFTGITSEDLPTRPGEIKRVNVPAEGIVVRFSKWHTRATDGRAPLWLCEHIAPEHKA